MPDPMRLLLVSNRLPVTVLADDYGIHYDESIGGVATGLGAVSRQYQTMWIGAANIPGEDAGKYKGRIEKEIYEKYSCVTVFLTRKAINEYYDGFSNSVLWPLFHGMLDTYDFPARWWHQYQAVNELFSEKIAEVVQPGDIIWINDYHLLLVPDLIRRRVPYHKIGLFLHTPFPDHESFKKMRLHEKLLEGMLGADQIGLYTDAYKARLADSIEHYRLDRNFGPCLSRDNARENQVQAFPIGVDTEYINRLLEKDHVKKLTESLRSRFEGRKVILSADRLDYTKGILPKIKAYELLLEQNSWVEEARIQLVLITAPSRMGLAAYRRLFREIASLVSSVNDRHGDNQWQPIYHIDNNVKFEEMLAFFKISDVAVVTPFQDGMNLISKEYLYVSGREGGTLILSKNAGSAAELTDAYLVDPYNVPEIAEAITKSLTIDRRDQIAKNEVMMERLEIQTASKWSRDFLLAISN